MRSVLITGGAGFMGESLVHVWRAARQWPAASGAACRPLITFVTDRPGHDHPYAIDATKLAGELGNRCSVAFETGVSQTVHWYLDQEDWWRDVTSGAYKAWIDKNHSFRIAV
jgi:dTDP-glucose 4,6-dehydratase